MGAARGASGAGNVGGGGTGADADTGAGDAERAPLADEPPVVACEATDWRRFAASAGFGDAVLGAVRAGGIPFVGRPANMASMVGRRAAPNGVERKSLGSAKTTVIAHSPKGSKVDSHLM